MHVTDRALVKKEQGTKRFSTSADYRLRHSETKKHCFAKCCFVNQTVLDSRHMFSAEHVRNSQSTVYLKSHGFVHDFQLSRLCFALSTTGIADWCFDDILFTVCAIPKQVTLTCKTGWTSVCLIREALFSETLFIVSE